MSDTRFSFPEAVRLLDSLQIKIDLRRIHNFFKLLKIFF